MDYRPSTITRFTGRLQALPPPTPRCGDDAFANVYPFEVLDLEQGALPHAVAWVIVPCPDLKGEGFFVVNRTYRLQATDDLTASRRYAVQDSYAKVRTNLYWCLDIDFFS